MPFVDITGKASIEGIARRLGITTGAPFEQTALDILFGARQSLRGLSSRHLQAASVYASCRLFGIPRTMKEVAKASEVTTSSLARSYRKILNETGLKVPIQEPAAFVPGIASRAGLDPLTERRALGILEVLKNKRVTAGKDPSAMAAAALCAACQGSPVAGACATQKSIARAAGVSEVTVRTRLRGILSVLNSRRVF